MYIFELFGMIWLELSRFKQNVEPIIFCIQGEKWTGGQSPIQGPGQSMFFSQLEF